MTAGILRRRYLSNIEKSSNPVQYVFALNEFMYYEYTVFRHNLKGIFNNRF